MSKSWLVRCVVVGLCLLVGVRAEAAGMQAKDTPQAAPSRQSETLPAGVRHVGGGVSAPIPIYSPEPVFDQPFTKELQQLVSGLIVALIVDEQGRPTNVHLVRSDMDLGERLVEAVKQYKFKPAMENGRPVAVDLNIHVDID